MSLPRSSLFLMAFATGATVANLYYCQPLLAEIASTFGVGAKEAGLLPTLTQAGYALGMLFLVPLGDMFPRRRLALLFTLLAAASAGAMACAPVFGLALAASFFLGLFTMTPQILIPFAANLARAEERGKVVGTMMSGLLLGILLARAFSGFMAAFGWRFLYLLVTAALIFIAGLLAWRLPRDAPAYRGSYGGLLLSLWQIARAQPVLREAAFFGAMLFGAFSAFWSTLIYFVGGFGLGPRAVGMFGLLGAGAALVGPAVGARMDKSDPRGLTAQMLYLTFGAFAVYLVSARSLFGIAIGVLLMDIGVQAGHISNQSRVFSLLPEARSRLQTIYMFSYFTGGALGSAVGSWAWEHFGWAGVCGSAMALLGLALARYHLAPAR